MRAVTALLVRKSGILRGRQESFLRCELVFYEVMDWSDWMGRFTSPLGFGTIGEVLGAGIRSRLGSIG